MNHAMIKTGMMAALTALPVLLCDAATLYNNRLKQGETPKFFLPDGTEVPNNTVVADKGCDVVTVDIRTDNPTISSAYEFNSWTIANTNTTAFSGPWCDGGGSVTLRGGGLTMAANNQIRFGHKGNLVRVKLAESQTWSGPSSGTAWSEFAIGCNSSWSGYYYLCRIAALKDIVWTIDGRIKVELTASNDLSNVDIVVNPKARLILVEKWNEQTFCPFLNAKSLTLKGGDTESSVPLFTVGAQNPTVFAGATSYAPATFDDATVSPEVHLVDGASVNGGTVDYGVSALYVSGGDSTFSGTVTFKKPVAIDVAAGASLAFTGALSADDGAGISLSGAGSLKFAKNVIAIPVAGNGTICCDPGEGEETVLNGDLSGFSGTIRVKSGVLAIHQDALIGQSAQIVTDEGASVQHLDAGSYGDFTSADGRAYYRSADGVAHQLLYMNELTANGTFGSKAKFREVQDVEQTAAWRNGSVLVIDRRMKGGLTNEGDSRVETEGIIVTETATPEGGNYFDGAADFIVGERGIEFRRTDCTLDFFKNNRYFSLSESQVWKGPAAEVTSSSSARINVGGSWNYMYAGGALTAPKEIDLVLEGDLWTYFYYPANAMTNINLIARKPVRIGLSCPGANSTYAALPAAEKWIGTINAKTITFDGDVNLVIDYLNERVPVITAEMLSRKIILKNGAAFGVSGKKWSGVSFAAGAGNGTMTGTYSPLDEVFTLSAEAGATLDASGATFKQAADAPTSLALEGPGTIRLAVDRVLLAGGVSAVSAALELTGSGSWTAPLSSARGLAIAAEGSIAVSDEALAGYGQDEIAVTSGTLILESAASIPQGCKVVTSGTGALSLADPSGFDADVHMGGTQNFQTDNALVVSDAARENETLAVPAGQTLHVFGSGLKDSSSVSLAAGASIVFHRTATVSAAVTIAGASTISAAADAEGTFAGPVTIGNSSTATGACDIYAYGAIVFAGATRGYKTPLYQRSGLIVVRGGLVLNGSGGGFYMCAGRCVVTNCTMSSSTYGHVYLNLPDQTGDVLLEIASGGKLSMGNNGTLCIGGSNRFESRVLINGGTMDDASPDWVKFNDGGTGNGVFEFASGLMNSERRFLTSHKPGSGTGAAKFIWRGGTWKLKRIANTYVNHHLFQANAADCGIEFSVEGPDCVLDLSSFVFADSISNFNGGVSTMVGRPGAKLTVKGKKNVATKLTLANFTPNGMALDLNPVPSCDVDIIGSGDDVELGWVVPGTGGVVRCTGTASPLLANYVVPGGETFRNSHVGDGWHSGFASAVAHDLVFWDGSTYMLTATAQGFGVLDFAGKVETSGTVRYAVEKAGGELPVVTGIELVHAAEGVSGDGEWAAVSGTLGRKSRIYSGEGALLFDHKPLSLRVFIR